MNRTGSMVIKVEDVGKKYLIGHQVSSIKDTFRFGLSYLRGGQRRTVEEFWALQNMAFEVKQGEAVGIIGKNGSGKSTLLKILSRITYPTKGRFEVRGRVSSLLEVGTGFHPELTGRENIYLNGTILGMTRAEIRAQFDQIIAFSGVERFLDTPVKHYSSGMYVRLAFAVAAHLEPEILIIDEVLAVGDAEFQKKCLGKMDEVTKQGRTVIFVSHNMLAVGEFCTRGILLENGQITTDGSARQAIEQYLHHANHAYQPYLNPKAHPMSISEVSLAHGRGSVSFEQKIGIHLKVNLPSAAQHAIGLGLSVKHVHGEKLFTTFKHLEGERLTADYQIEIPARVLLNGFYAIDAQLFSPEGKVHEQLHDVCHFSVQDAQHAPTGSFSDTHGFVHIDCEWKER